MLADRFGEGEKLGVVMGTVLSANTLGAITGPIIGGALYQYWGYSAPFVFCAVLAFFDFLSILMIIEPYELHRESILNDVTNEEDFTAATDISMTNNLSLWSLIKDWNIITVCIAVVMIAGVFSGMYFACDIIHSINIM
jgi:MFS transporter, DHA1 family, solute carrier family 18 (vesicular amine transporter), member 1/2